MIAAIWARPVTWARSLTTVVSERTQKRTSTAIGPNPTVRLTDALTQSATRSHPPLFHLSRQDSPDMVLSAEEARVVACLVEKEATVPDSYPLTLNSLRLACNQTSNRNPIVAWDDRTVEAALLSLKSMGLVRFVHPSHGGRTIRYRHVADERWRLSKGELAVLAVLVLRGPQTTGEVRTRTERMIGPDDGTVEEILDMLTARSPEPFAARVARRPGEREGRWAQALAGEPEDAIGRGDDTQELDRLDDDTGPMPAPAKTPPTAAASPDLARDVAELWSRVERLERLLGLSEDVAADGR